MIRYYTELLGQADEISDEDLVTAADQTRYERRIVELERKNEAIHELAQEALRTVAELKAALCENGRS